MDAKELILHLNQTDECNWIEAKKGQAIDRSILETVCAYSNEPGLGGGYILLGVAQEDNSLFPSYEVKGVDMTDKLQLDLSSQCASIFNQPVRPEIEVECIGDKNVLLIHIQELPEGQKPVYFKNEGLPRGAYRRIGSADQRCTDDDLFIFYNKEDSFDSSLIIDSSIEDISEEAVELYRNLRRKVNAYAEELQYNDMELLQSLGCLKKESDVFRLSYAGLLLFGKRSAHRRLLPMVRVDYIRVPGNVWVEDPDNRFITVDMRGSLLEMVQRVFSQITDDLPKGFLLAESEIQAESVGLPARVLREALVNAFIHRSYRVNQPIQIIRYGNRLEIANPGFSLKPEEYLGEPGSQNRNPFISAVFHETNLAETKGSGIRIMRSLMQKAKLIPPTFESDHGRNQFTARLLLHHFLGVEDVQWLSLFEHYNLNEDQKMALIFTKEVGAIDNSSYRQLNSVDLLKASTDLRDLRNKEILFQMGKGKGTYYIQGNVFKKHISNNLSDNEISAPPDTLSAPPDTLSAPPHHTLSAPPHALNAPPEELNAPPEELDDDNEPLNMNLIDSLPDLLKEKIEFLPERVNDSNIIQQLIIELCAWKPLSSVELSGILGKSEKYLLRNFITPLRIAGKINFTIPEMPNHPEQAYLTIIKIEDEI